MAGVDYLNETYEILESLKSSRGNTIYKARHKRLDKIVIIKSINNNPFAKKEMEILKELRHINLPIVIDYIENNNQFFIVMEYINGKNIKSYIEEKGCLNEIRTVDFGIKLCEATEYLHKRNIIHCDIKPSNIMLNEENELILIDFNISCMGDNIIARGYSKGYSAPELVASFKRMNDDKKLIIDERVDIYSIGATLYYMLFGETIIKTGQIHEVDINGGIIRIINKCLNINRKNRYKDIRLLKRALKNVKFNIRYKALVYILSVLLFNIVIFIIYLGVYTSIISNNKKEYDILSDDLYRKQIILQETGKYLNEFIGKLDEKEIYNKIGTKKE